ncbi:MAG: glycosyltransferase family 2 protein [Candidatus Aenigmarchaeota archaeon]|nr:glycosyltransferase family 2 protein [Candidatus Aenigmarchaeota archaeon]
MRAPEISIVIPTYNRSYHLKMALDSIVSQNPKGIEILISDNASKDNTMLLCKGYAKKYPFVRYFRNGKNLEFDKNILSGIKKAKGKYIWLFGDDDVMNNDAIDYVKKLIENNNKVGIITVNYKIKNFKTGKVFNKKIIDINSTEKLTSNEFLGKVAHYLVFVSINIIRRDLIKKIFIKTKNYIGSGIVHYFIVLSACGINKSALSSDKILVTQYFNTTRYNENKKGADKEVDNLDSFDINIIWFHKILLDVKHYYGSIAIYKFVNNYISYSMKCEVYDTKLKGRLNLRRMLFLFKLHWKYPNFWFYIFPLFFIPRKILPVLPKMIKKLKVF